MPQAQAQPYDVIIVGGGFAGLALALALARSGCGLEIAVVDREQPRDGPGLLDPRAFALSGSSRGLLEAIGVWAAVADDAEAVTGIDITDSALSDAMRPVLLRYETSAEGRPQMLIMGAQCLRRALNEAARAEPRIRMVAPAQVARLQHEPAAIAIGLTDGSLVEGRLAVAADGARSSTRDMAGIGVVGGSFRQRGIAAIVGHEREHGGRAVQHFLPAGPFALLPMKGRRCCITWSENEDAAAHIMAMGDADFLAETQQRAGWRLGALRLESPRASWPLGGHLARSLVARRVALIGDTARSVHPIAGQGVNLGFRDVAALAEAVVDGVRLGFEPGDAAILERYERWRRTDGVQSAATFAALNALFSNDFTWLRALRDAGLGLVDRLPRLKQMLVVEAAGLTGEVPRLLRGEPL